MILISINSPKKILKSAKGAAFVWVFKYDETELDFTL